MGMLKWERIDPELHANAWTAFSGEIHVASVHETDDADCRFHWRAKLSIPDLKVPYGGCVATLEEAFAETEAFWRELVRRANLMPVTEAPPKAPPLKRYQFDENTWFVEFDGMMMIGTIRRPDEPDEDLNDGLWHWSAKDVLHHRITPQYGANADLEDSFRALEDYWGRWLGEVGLMARPQS